MRRQTWNSSPPVSACRVQQIQTRARRRIWQGRLSSAGQRARRGYEINKENLRESARAIGDVSKSLSQCLKKLEDGSVRTPGIVDQLKRQLSGVVNELEQLQRTSDFALDGASGG